VLLPRQQAKLARGAKDEGARHVSDSQYRNRRDRHRYRQELVPRRGPRCARRHRAAAKSGRVAKWSHGLPIYRLEQLDLQPLHRVRERLVSQRTGIITRFAPSCWNAGSPCARVSAFCARNCPPSLRRAPMPCRHARMLRVMSLWQLKTIEHDLVDVGPAIVARACEMVGRDRSGRDGAGRRQAATSRLGSRPPISQLPASSDEATACSTPAPIERDSSGCIRVAALTRKRASAAAAACKASPRSSTPLHGLDEILKTLFFSRLILCDGGLRVVSRESCFRQGCSAVREHRRSHRE
jgi:hypothetical protein